MSGHLKRKQEHSLFSRIKYMSPMRLITLSFLLIILIGFILLSMPFSVKGEVSLYDSFFTSVSATCVTGLSLHDMYTYWTFAGQIIILTLSQIGGLGTATFATVITLIIRKNLGFKDMMVVGESSGITTFKDTKSLAKTIISFTLISEAVGALILMIRFVPRFGSIGIWAAIFMSVSSYCNAGLDIFGFIGEGADISLFANDYLVVITIGVLVVLGGMGFLVIHDIYENKLRATFLRQERKKLRFHSKICLIMTALLIIFGFLVFFVCEFDSSMKGMSIPQKIFVSLFQSANMRTAGFSIVKIQGENDFSKIVSLILMLIGGCPGSTAGGIKVTTTAVLTMTVICTTLGKREVTIFRHRIPSITVYKAISVVALALLIIFIDTSIIVALNPHISLFEALYEAVAACSTSGHSDSLTPTLNTISQIFLMITMFIGRIGPITFGLSIAMKQKQKGEFILPEGKMIIG